MCRIEWKRPKWRLQNSHNCPRSVFIPCFFCRTVFYTIHSASVRSIHTVRIHFVRSISQKSVVQHNHTIQLEHVLVLANGKHSTIFRQRIGRCACESAQVTFQCCCTSRLAARDHRSPNKTTYNHDNFFAALVLSTTTIRVGKKSAAKVQITNTLSLQCSLRAPLTFSASLLTLARARASVGRDSVVWLSSPVPWLGSVVRSEFG